jgi:hypothetical protein
MTPEEAAAHAEEQAQILADNWNKGWGPCLRRAAELTGVSVDQLIAFRTMMAVVQLTTWRSPLTPTDIENLRKLNQLALDDLDNDKPWKDHP